MVDIADPAALLARAETIGVNRVEARLVQRVVKQMRSAAIVAARPDPEPVDPSPAELRRKAIAKAKLERRLATSTDKKLRSHKLGRAAALVASIDKTLLDGKSHRSSIAASRQKQVAGVRREKAIIAGHRNR